jgi:hypothetical protein
MTRMRDTIVFRSHVAASQRPALEALVFFNSCQARVTDGIADAVARFGSPEIVVEGERARVRTAHLDGVQCLFAVEARSGRPVGVALYLRADLEHISVLHVSIASQYASGGMLAGDQLLLRLMRELKRSTRRLKGIRRIELLYARDRSASGRWPLTVEAAL